MTIDLSVLDSRITSIITIKNQPVFLFIAGGNLSYLEYTNDNKTEMHTIQIDNHSFDVSETDQILFLDFNGDCISDLVLVSPKAIIFLKGSEEGDFQKSQ